MTSKLVVNEIAADTGISTITVGDNMSGVTFKTGTSNLHNVGIEIAGINVLGADTPIGAGATIYNSGAAVFTGIVTANAITIPADNAKIQIGASQDLELYHNGSNSFIVNKTGYLQINATETEAAMFINPNAAVRLCYDNDLKFETTSTGVKVFSAVSGNGILEVYSGDAGSAAGPEIKLYRNSSSPADADYLGQIKFAGESDTGVERNYAKITGKILDASNGTEDGIIEFAHIKAGSQTITGRFRSDSFQLLNGTALTVAGSTTVTGNIIPSSDSATDIGTNGVRFANIYADTLYGDGSNLTGVTSVGGNTGVDFNDSVKARFGTGNDLELYHNGTDSWIVNNTGYLRIKRKTTVF